MTFPVGRLMRRLLPEETLRRIENGELDPRPEARIERAIAQGYNVDETLYHSTSGAYGHMGDLGMLHLGDKGPNRNFWLAPDPKKAGSYTNEGGALYPMYLRSENPLEIDTEGSHWANIPLDSVQQDADVVRRLGGFDTLTEARDDYNWDIEDDVFSTDTLTTLGGEGGATSVRLNNIYDWGTGDLAEVSPEFGNEYASTVIGVPDPVGRVKSRWAMFDPDYKGGNILGGATGVGALGAAGYSDDADATFLGPMAKNAAHDMLGMAKTMESRGIDRDEIWKKTGWGRGVDGGWRYELSDAEGMRGTPGLQLKQTPTGYLMPEGPLRNLHGMDELAEEYPALGDITLGATRLDEADMKLQTGGGTFRGSSYPRTGRLTGGIDGTGEIEIGDMTGRAAPMVKEYRDVALHETQHGIQELENQARGTSSGISMKRAMGANSKEFREIDRLARQDPDVSGALSAIGDYRRQSAGSRFLDLYRDTSGRNPNREKQLAELADSFGIEFRGSQYVTDADIKFIEEDAAKLKETGDKLNKFTDKMTDEQLSVLQAEGQLSARSSAVDRISASEAYARSAGEVEARATEARADMTAGERRNRAPWFDYDRPEYQQYAYGNNGEVRPERLGPAFRDNELEDIRLLEASGMDEGTAFDVVSRANNPPLPPGSPEFNPAFAGAAVTTAATGAALYPQDADATMARLADRGLDLVQDQEGIYTLLDKNKNATAGEFYVQETTNPGYSMSVDSMLWPDYTRQGVGSEVYDALEEVRGDTLMPSEALTSQGAKFWAKRDPEKMLELLDRGYFMDPDMISEGLLSSGVDENRIAQAMGLGDAPKSTSLRDSINAASIAGATASQTAEAEPMQPYNYLQPQENTYTGDLLDELIAAGESSMLADRLNPARDVGPYEADLLSMGRTFDKTVAGAQNLYYKATGDEEGQARLAEEQAFKDRAFDPLAEKYPARTFMGEMAPYAATLPFGTSVAGGIALGGVEGGLYYDENSQGTNAAIGAGAGALFPGGAAAYRAAPRIMKGLTGATMAYPSLASDDAEGQPLLLAGRKWTERQAQKRAEELFGDSLQRVEYPGIYKPTNQLIDEGMAMYAPPSGSLDLFGTSRRDLSDMAHIADGDYRDGMPGIPMRPKGNPQAEALQTDKNARRVRALLKGTQETPMGEGMTGWYVMDPMYQRMAQLMPEDEAAAMYNRLNNITAMHSANSDVATEIARGSAANHALVTGQWDEYLRHGGEAFGKRSPDRPEWMDRVPGHMGHKTAHTSPAVKFLEAGDRMQSTAPKVPAYAHASGIPGVGIGRQNQFMVGDAHFARGIGLADVRKPRPQRWDKEKGQYVDPTYGESWTMPEATTIHGWFQQLAKDTGLDPVPAQANMWGMLSPQTGVQSTVGAPKLEILGDQIIKTARELGISPEEVRDAYLRGELYLSK